MKAIKAAAVQAAPVYLDLDASIAKAAGLARPLPCAPTSRQAGP